MMLQHPSFPQSLCRSAPTTVIKAENGSPPFSAAKSFQAKPLILNARNSMKNT